MSKDKVPMKMTHEEWAKQFKKCPEKYRCHASDLHGTLLWDKNKKGETVPRLTHIYCNALATFIWHRCMYRYCRKLGD